MLITTVPVCTNMPGLKLPVPRSAAPIATIANCSAIAGMNHCRYCSVAMRMPSLALWFGGVLMTQSASRPPGTTIATTIDSTCDWLNRKIARS